MEQINRLDKEVDITNEELDKQNKSLKDIVEKYRSPNKFCMDVVMVCVLLGMAAAIYETIKG
jgi:SYP7 family syntaxin